METAATLLCPMILPVGEVQSTYFDEPTTEAAPAQEATTAVEED
jgi:hypothetical protein